MFRDSEFAAVQILVMSSRVWQTADMSCLPDDLTGARLMVLYTIWQHGPISTANIAEIEKVASPTITRMIGELEKQKLITRTRSAQDGRVSLLSLSKKGRRVFYDALRLACSPVCARLDTLTAEERHIVEDAAKILNRLSTDEPDTCGKKVRFESEKPRVRRIGR